MSDEFCNARDLIAIGEKVVEMADRVEKMDRVSPGCGAAWTFEMDGIRYRCSLKIDREVR